MSGSLRETLRQDAGRSALRRRRLVDGNLGRGRGWMFTKLRRRRDAGNRPRHQTVASLIEGALSLRVLPVIDSRAPDRLPSLVLLSAAERTTDQVQTTVVAPVDEKENAAMPAPDQAMLPRHRLGSSHRSQNLIVFQNRCPSFVRSVPVRTELKKLRDLGCKKLKLALRMPTYSMQPSSYPTDTAVSRR